MKTFFRLPLAVRAEIISYLVKQEMPEASPKEANELRVDWNTYDDSYLLKTYNYNRNMNGLPARVFPTEEG